MHPTPRTGGLQEGVDHHEGHGDHRARRLLHEADGQVDAPAKEDEHAEPEAAQNEERDA